MAAQTNQEEAIKNCFNNFVDYLASKDVNSAMDLLDSQTKEYYNSITDLVKNASKNDIIVSSLLEQILIVNERLRLTKEDLLNVHASDIFEQITQISTPTRKDYPIELDEVTIEEDKAMVSILMYGQKIHLPEELQTEKSNFNIVFFNESGLWKFNLLNVLKLAEYSLSHDQLMNELLEEEGKSLLELYIESLEMSHGRRFSAQGWNPVGTWSVDRLPTLTEEEKQHLMRELSGGDLFKEEIEEDRVAIVEGLKIIEDPESVRQLITDIKSKIGEKNKASYSPADWYYAGDKKIIAGFIDTLSFGSITNKTKYIQYLNSYEYRHQPIYNQKIIDLILANIKNPSMPKECIELAFEKRIPGWKESFENLIKQEQTPNAKAIISCLAEEGSSVVWLEKILEKAKNDFDIQNELIIDGLLIHLEHKNQHNSELLTQIADQIHAGMDPDIQISDVPSRLLSFLMLCGSKSVMHLSKKVYDHQPVKDLALLYLAKYDGINYEDEILPRFKYDEESDELVGLPAIVKFVNSQNDKEALKKIIREFGIIYKNQSKTPGYFGPLASFLTALHLMNAASIINEIPKLLNNEYLANKIVTILIILRDGPYQLINDLYDLEMIDKSKKADMEMIVQNSADIKRGQYEQIELLYESGIYVDIPYDHYWGPDDYIRYFKKISGGVLDSVDLYWNWCEDDFYFEIFAIGEDKVYHGVKWIGEGMTMVQEILNLVLEDLNVDNKIVSIRVSFSENAEFMYGDENNIKIFESKYSKLDVRGCLYSD